MSGRPRPTKSSIIKSGWGNRLMFQASYGLRMDPDDIEEGNLILEELLKSAIEEWEEEQRAAAASS
ncbi:hypothetical protein AURDEDRAFT_173030 [Auricularia subglabra TFB-10046 SS5]|uniref:Uncharacterized protein n=1 Tax=Auricularia subglabra (strain TFB-10046 / SS5) TaxID=717982 RepID=J0WWH0_AURST|nr:hypothetical protein AURDEDRAFT_173030 [Auricularia subglabra TFB-10046 SS5]